MVQFNLISVLKSVNQRLCGAGFATHASQHVAKRRPHYSPKLEALEDRSLPSTSPLFSPLQSIGTDQNHAGQFGAHHAAQVVILTPHSGDALGRYVTITGKLENAGHRWPVVLVQPVLAGEPWYVQPAVLSVNADGTFSAQIYVGNASTPPGTSFRIEVILANNHTQAQHHYLEGSTLKVLPKGLVTAPVVVVTHAGVPVIIRA